MNFVITYKHLETCDKVWHQVCAPSMEEAIEIAGARLADPDAWTLLETRTC